MMAACHGAQSGESDTTGASTDATTSRPSDAESSDVATGSTEVGPAIVEGECETVVEDLVVSYAFWDALELAPGAPIPAERLAEVERLSLHTKSVASLAGLECAGGLLTLSLQSDGTGGNSPHTVTDLSPLLGLPRLQRLELRYGAFGDITLLPGIPTLNHLDLRSSMVSDLSVLSSLPVLQTLIISDTPVSDLAPVAGCTSLANLYARGTPIVDVAVLAGSDSLRHVEIDDTAVTEVAALAGMPGLLGLDVSRTAVANLSAFSESGLSQLFASETQIGAIPESLPITNGRFAGNGIVDISPLLTWEGPASVDLSDNAIEDVSPLLSLPWDFGNGACLHIRLQGNPLSHPDTANVIQQACAAYSVVIEAENGLGCMHQQCITSD